MNKGLGIALIIIGLVIIIWGSVGFKTRKNVADVGPIHATKTETHHVPYAPIAGAIVLIGGVAVLLTGRR